MADSIAPEFQRFVATERRANRLAAPRDSLDEGDVLDPVNVKGAQAAELLRVAALRASGIYRATRRTEVVWVDGDRELAIGVAKIDVRLAEGLLTILVPVRCDQTGDALVEVPFVVGAPGDPAGLFASTLRQPIGPPIVVRAWGDALVAFAWQCLLGLVTGLAGAVGKDRRGNVLVPVELTVGRGALQVVPMARHRFSGSSGLKASTATAPVRGGTPR